MEPAEKLLTVTTVEAATTTHEYDERDWRVRTIDPLERITHYEHDAAGRVVTLIDPLERETHFTHDVDGNMTYGPLPGEEDFVNYNFDARNRLKGVGGVTDTYDSENNRIAKTTSDGTTTYVFDPHGDALPRVLVRERPDESLTYYVYGIGLLYDLARQRGDGALVRACPEGGLNRVPSGRDKPQVDEQDDATYYHFDQSGSTIALTDDVGEVTDRIEYTP